MRFQAEAGEWSRGREVSRSSKIGLRKKPDIEEAGWKILRWNSACNKRAYMEEGLARLSDLQMLGTVSTK